jgi:hypothetical protein
MTPESVDKPSRTVVRRMDIGGVSVSSPAALNGNRPLVKPTARGPNCSAISGDLKVEMRKRRFQTFKASENSLSVSENASEGGIPVKVAKMRFRIRAVSKLKL